MYKRPSNSIKTTGDYIFKTKDKNYNLESFLFERQNDTEDSLQIQDELRGELGSIIIKNSSWNRLSNGDAIRAKSSKGNVSGSLVRAKKMVKGGGVGALLDQRKQLLEELIDSDIIDEEHGYYEDIKGAIQSNDSEQMREIIDELLSSGFIYKDDWDYKLAIKLSKEGKKFDLGGDVDDSDDYGTFEIYKNGGSIEVNVVNSDKRYDEKEYDWILGDKDKDGVANADDVKPLDKTKSDIIDTPTITTGIKSLISLKKSLDSTMFSFIDDLKNVAPDNSKIYARTKTPYSVLDKLIKKRLSTITDLIGTTIVTGDKKELDSVKKYIDSGKLGKIIELEDMYKNPKGGYRAYHYLIERNGMSIELQLKTKRQKALNELSHEPYKLGKINSALLLKITEIANRADEGDNGAIKEYNEFMKQPDIENVFYAEKMGNGGGVGNFKMVSFPIDKDYKYYVVDEDEDNYLTVQEDKYDKWKNANKIDRAEYYSEWIPKKEMVKTMNKMNKYAVGGEVGNQVSFKGDYGTPRSGIVKEKRGSSYIVATDNGDRLVDSYEVISFSDAPMEKKKRFGFFKDGGEIESKILDLQEVINGDFPQFAKDKAKSEIERLEKQLDNKSNDDLLIYFESGDGESFIYSITDLKGKEFFQTYSSSLVSKEWYDKKDKLESKFSKEIFEHDHDDKKYYGVIVVKGNNSEVYKTGTDEWENIKNKLHESKETKAEEKAEHKKGGSEYKSKLEKDLEKELHRLQRDLNSSRLQTYREGDNSEEEKARQRERASKLARFNEVLALLNEKDNGKESVLDEKEELNATIQKLYGIEGKAEDLINYQSGGIQAQPIDKIKKYVEYVNKEVSKLNVPFGSEVYDVLEDENAHSLNLTLGLLGFYKNEKDNGSWARTRTSYKDLVNTVNEIKGIKTEYKVGDPTTKPTTRKAPIKKAVAKKVVVKKDLPKIKVGDTIKVYATNGDLIIDEIFNNSKGEVSYRGKYIANDNLKSYHSSKKTYEYILNEQDTIVKPKADHKKLVAKLKAKKGATPSNEPTKGHKRSESSDRKREALPLGKRISADGSVYYENRLNHADMNKEDKFKEGGEIKKADRIEKMVENWRKYGFAISSVSKTNDDADFFKTLKIDQDEVGITSQTGNDVVYYNTKVKNKFNRDKFEEGGEVKSSGWGLKFLKW